MGFNRRGQRTPKPIRVHCRGGSEGYGRPDRMLRGTNVVGYGASVSPREVPTRVLNWYFCVCIPGTLKSRSPASQPVENLLLADNVRGGPIT